MTTPLAPRLETLLVEDHHAPLLAEFIRTVWDPAATTESVRAARHAEALANVAEPGVAPPTWIALQAERVLGYVTTIPVQFWDGERDWPGYWIKGLMVHPDFRNGPIGFMVLKAAVAALPRTGALAVAAPARRLFEALKFRDLGPIPNWVRPLRVGRILNRLDLEGLGLGGVPPWAARGLRVARATGLAGLAGAVGTGLLRATSAAVRIPAVHLETEWPRAAPDALELNQLWQRIAPGLRSGVIRNAQYLLHRYPSGDRSPYRWVAARLRGALVGIAVLRRPSAEGDPRLRGIRVATLAEMLFPVEEPPIGLALLGAVESLARLEDADVVLASSSTPGVHSLLRKQWYLPIAGNVHFLLRDVTESAPSFGKGLRDWWLARGDGSADEVF